MKLLFTNILIFCIFFSAKVQAQHKNNGVVVGTILHSENKILPNASIEICSISSERKCFFTISDNNGNFQFESLPVNYYSLTITSIGYTSKRIDSIYIREERMEFNLNDIILSSKIKTDVEVVIWSERPLIENKDGKIIYNVGETAAANSSNVNELLQKTPLVTIDPNGTILLKGKEVKILIDEKPVELNAKQLQEMLESMPGSFIDKIEVMTNPPPQYANERGGVINIVSKKGKVGFTLRANTYSGTRGEIGAGLASTYRKKKLSAQINISLSNNTYTGNSFYNRQNIYRDSTNSLNSCSKYVNKTIRPNFKWSADYDFNKRNIANVGISYNSNFGENDSQSEFININNNSIAYKSNDRGISSDTKNKTLNISSSYLWKDKKQTGVVKMIGSVVLSNNRNDRNFYQTFYGINRTALGNDSTQFQTNFSESYNYAMRLNYDKSLDSGKYFISTGINYFDNNSYNNLDASYFRKSTNTIIPQQALENELNFKQQITQGRIALKYRIKTDLFITSGLQVEHTYQSTNHLSKNKTYNNSYWNYIPYMLFTYKWKNNYNISVSYKKTIQRPGINETNPAVDITDPYNIKSGNPYLLPSYAHNTDLSIGKQSKKLNYNLSIGYNSLLNLYAPIRTLQQDGRTFIIYENIGNRKEYEASIWGAYTISKVIKISSSIGYSYNAYGSFDKTILRYRNGENFSSNINGSYTPKDIMQYGAAITYNRFANPQGTVRSNISMNFNVQRKFINKAFIVTLSAIDPFINQQNTTYTSGSNFTIQQYSFTQTRNFKLNIAYNFIKKRKNGKPKNISKGKKKNNDF